MKITDWHIINSHSDVVGKITTSRNNLEAAGRKLKFRYGEFAPYFALEKAGEREIQDTKITQAEGTNDDIPEN